MAKIAVIGAGISGLTCAGKLSAAGHVVSVFDKGRTAGGRVSTRHHREYSELSFDHGAQYFTARDPEFKAIVEEWQEKSIVAEWQGEIAEIDLRDGKLSSTSKSTTRLVGTPNMQRIAQALIGNLIVHEGKRVISILKQSGCFSLTLDDGIQFGNFDLIVMALPPAQSALLLDIDETLKSQALSVKMNPCWALMCAFEERLPLKFDGIFVNNGTLSWAARDSSKPGRPPGERWVLHASGDWSRAHLEDSADFIGSALLAEFEKTIVAAHVRPYFLRCHRWRYAIPATPVPQLYLLSDCQSIALCGDWCGGPRVEGAYLSGLNLARRIIGRS